MNENADMIAMLCRRIKIARIEKNLSQIELAERSNLGIATIKRIELGESITLLTLISVLRGLDELDQLRNLLAHNELKIASQKNVQQRKRKLKEKESQTKEEIAGDDFIVSNLHNMHWKY
ncbi:helix-turn-helix domain-containing protein [Orbus mooreae]|uniref:helix-turn-helix domain-containing protein n=1 Tax=Orbus mooreae TaxID=3074107 RepID=UPI00370DC02A